MTKRNCDACGDDKELRSGKSFANGHFYCRACIISSVHFGERTVCELSGEFLRQSEPACIKGQQISP